MGTRSEQTGRAPVVLPVRFAAPSVGIARHQLEDWLRGLDIARRTIDDARIVISELVGNSVRHAQPLSDGTILVSWQIEPRGLLVTVTDGGSGTRPRTVHAPASALAGRGMAIVESLSVTWWTDRKQARSTVHAIVEL